MRAGRVVWPDSRETWEASRGQQAERAARRELGVPAGEDQLEADDADPDSCAAPLPTGYHGRSSREVDSEVDARRAAIRYNISRARKEAARAGLAERELAERERSLIPVEEVRANAYVVCGTIRADLLALPPKVSLRCEGKTAGEISRILDDEINSILERWHRGEFGPPRSEQQA